MPHHHAAQLTPPADQAIVVFIRDTQTNLRTGYKTRSAVRDGDVDVTKWATGEFRCDCARAPLVHGPGEYECGETRFVIDRIVLWDTGETIYSESGLT